MLEAVARAGGLCLRRLELVYNRTLPASPIDIPSFHVLSTLVIDIDHKAPGSTIRVPRTTVIPQLHTLDILRIPDWLADSFSRFE